MKRISTFLLFTLFGLNIFAHDKTYTEIEELYGQAIVSVNIAKKDGTAYSGTGFIVNENGIIATAGHVIEDALIINLTFKNGVISKEAKVIAKSAQETVDLALLQIPNENLPCVIFGDSDRVKAGQDIAVIGNPRRLQNTITNGLISQLRLVAPGIIWQQISAPISPNSSGSPVFNKEGQVIGIAVSSLKGEENQNLNFAIPSNYLQDLMRQNHIPFIIEDNSAEELSYLDKAKNYILKAWRILKQKSAALFD